MTFWVALKARCLHYGEQNLVPKRGGGWKAVASNKNTLSYDETSNPSTLLGADQPRLAARRCCLCTWQRAWLQQEERLSLGQVRHENSVTHHSRRSWIGPRPPGRKTPASAKTTRAGNIFGARLPGISGCRKQRYYFYV